MPMDSLVRELFTEIGRIPLIDPHSHINPHRPAARTLDDILGYHYYTELAHSAGMDQKPLAADFDPPDVGRDSALDPLAGGAIVPGGVVQAIERPGDADGRVAQRVGRRSMQDDGVMQLAASRRVEQQRGGFIHGSTASTRLKTSSAEPFASMTRNRPGSAAASAR